VCLCIVEIQPSVAVSETQQVANFASQTDEDAAITRYVFHIGLGEMIYQLLLQGFDSSACDNVSNKLVNSGVIGPYDRQKIRDQESASGKIKRLLMVLREMSAFEFECFLTTLVETGQQEVAAAVVQTLHTVAEQGQNPLQYACGKAYVVCAVLLLLYCRPIFVSWQTATHKHHIISNRTEDKCNIYQGGCKGPQEPMCPTTKINQSEKI